MPNGVDSEIAVFVALLFLAMLYALTRFPTFTNLRYVLPLFPLLLLAFALAWRIAVPWRFARLAGLGMVGCLFLASVNRTVDPISKAVYGTFGFGRHRLLAMTSFTGECCGYGRDQLEYNLEYTRLATVQDSIYGALRPGAGTVIVSEREADWLLQGKLDERTFHRTLRDRGAFRPRYLSLRALNSIPSRPDEIFVIEYPNIPASADAAQLSRDYRIEEALSFGEGGYEIPVLRMTRRAAAEGSR